MVNKVMEIKAFYKDLFFPENTSYTMQYVWQEKLHRDILLHFSVNKCGKPFVPNNKSKNWALLRGHHQF